MSRVRGSPSDCLAPSVRPEPPSECLALAVALRAAADDPGRTPLITGEVLSICEVPSDQLHPELLSMRIPRMCCVNRAPRPCPDSELQIALGPEVGRP